MVMTINEALQRKFGLDLDGAYNCSGPENVKCALRVALRSAADRVMEIGGACGSNEVELAHLADYTGHLVLAINGEGLTNV